MHIKIKFLLFFVSLAASVSAQKNLIIYHINGTVNTVSGNKISVAKRGDVLIKNSSLEVTRGADCMLIEEKGKSIKVTSGNYSFEVLQKMLASNTAAGTSQKFFSYVYSNMFYGKKGDKLSVAPVVFRGDELMKLPADNTIIISDAFTLGWKKPAGKIPVHISIWDKTDQKILDTVLKNSVSLQMDAIKNNFLPGNIYKWKSEESGTRQPKEKYFHFIIARNSDRKEILKDIRLLQNKTYPRELKAQMQQDIFRKWEQHYLEKK